MGKKLITVSTLSKFKELQDAHNKTLLDKKQDNLVYDAKPTKGSSNSVTSGGIYDGSLVEVYKGTQKVNSIQADGTDYILKQGGNSIAVINIAKDRVIDSGEIIEATGQERKGTSSNAVLANLTPGDKYMKLHINNGDQLNDLLWTNVNELFRDYTGNDGSKVTITTDNNVIKAEIKRGTIEKSDLVGTLQNEISNATSNLTVVQGNDSVQGSIKQQIKSLSDKISGDLVKNSDIATIQQVDSLFS